MKDSGMAVFDWMLQLAAFLAVMFVLHASLAHADMRPETQRAAIEEALIAGVSPSLVLAVTASCDDRGKSVTRSSIRRDVSDLQSALARSSGRLDLALSRFAAIRGIVASGRYAEDIQKRMRDLDANARVAARKIGAPVAARRHALDDFDTSLGAKLRRASRRLDDFPPTPRRS